MNFKALAKMMESPEQRAKAAEGFAERQKEREKQFIKDGKKWEPSAKWYERSYDI